MLNYIIMELYLPIKNFEDYSISSKGNVVSHKKKTPKKLKPKIDRFGYYRVCLQQNNIIKYFFIHRLVAEHFFIKEKNRTQVNHKNGIKSDNRVENLEWVNASENMIHSYKKLNRNKKATPVVRLNDNKNYKSIKEASIDNNVSTNSIINCLSGRSKTSAGYSWKYK